MSFLTGDDLKSEVAAIMQECEPCCAVAFWGRGAAGRFGLQSRAKIVCNLATGGTNPDEILALQATGHTVLQHDQLHAKVYLGRSQAVVTSANASANGLGLEASEQARWIEAGFLTSDVQPIRKWFNNLWMNSGEITANHIAMARGLWEARRSVTPALRSFVDFDPARSNLPLVYPRSTEGTYEIHGSGTEREFGPAADPTETELALDLSLHLDTDDDLPFVSPGTWVLFWRQRHDGLAHQQPNLRWGRTTR